ncbi:prepilin peptidase [Fictibacillus aquaticus]|uniref:Prepilin peptidase n=1 Tax=Fictibacillus aquaticus TaxID=2021314 RepID=A0A235FGM7_9BACL|nr:A24 family peptidase [Fictibacillus aquaticus]OYD59865.1 prepilin peptidase [Fictibacillus aquaticus]
MNYLLHTYIFIAGLIFGSFYNVVGLRIPKKESIIHPGSHCVTCDRSLHWSELVPVLSWVFQGGKCRGCKTSISFIYPLIELSTAILFTISPLVVGWSKELPVALALVSLLVIVLVSDIKYMIIPDKVLLFFLPVFIVLRIISPLNPWWDMLAGAVLGFCLLLLIAVISKGGMGGGDIKLMGVLGIVLGWKAVLMTFFLASFSGAVIGISLMATGKVKRREPIPFGPFLVLGALCSYFLYDELISLYLYILR